MKIPYHNETDKFVHIGPVTIAPNATRDVEESHIPGYKPKPTADLDAPADPLSELLKLSVANIVVQFTGLSNEDLDRLGEIEQLKGDKARKSLLEAIAEEMLKRAE